MAWREGLGKLKNKGLIIEKGKCGCSLLPPCMNSLGIRNLTTIPRTVGFSDGAYNMCHPLQGTAAYEAKATLTPEMNSGSQPSTCIRLSITEVGVAGLVLGGIQDCTGPAYRVPCWRGETAY
jgi:hypothetical protein